ncbi:oxygen-independent coproporphyrinogen III oxidase [Thiococcus pfennigii]|jgi:oxygen-independent coproporphyrinogen-3 oxidase|uniref:oxygen-independent coproporphyrinogen III oxidase n=1 Tax=Thiococcus pfennigii TaxID=1057 RepID=UPI001904BDED|nr:oxygen-independent coproporphyrinogen III oxidase [Thiococcus pfennigii]MBK1700900.1 oxygen-independent coproporphyrinogen III oxidase [Thiococcus pfennigii]MBK1733616.1 oxygen-independent coproporphyrinogen III oxidase [Thiococcus pfennigii]
MTASLSVERIPGPVEQIAPAWRHLYSIPSRGKWDAAFGPAEYQHALGAIAACPDRALSVYIHIPFCPVRCLYCGCNTTVTHSSERIDHYLDHLEREMAMVAGPLGARRDLLHLHVGGGTPNYLNDAQLVRLMEMVDRHFRILGETDTSIECNPRRVCAGQLALLRGLGFRRINFGVQDLQPQVQKAIGRIQSAEMVRDVYGMAREAGFECIGFDLVYGLPHQTAKGFQATVDEIIDLGPDRVACFPYAHIPEQRPHQHAIDSARLPSKLDRLTLFHHAVSRFTRSGYSWIGLDSFVLDTDELAIAQDEGRLGRNCVDYTTTPADQLISFGMGAIGDLDGLLVQNHESIAAWQHALAEGRLPVAHGQRLDESERRRRATIVQLICNLKVPIALARTGLPREYARRNEYLDYGLIEIDEEYIRITPRGRYYLHSLCIDPSTPLHEDHALWPLLRNI